MDPLLLLLLLKLQISECESCLPWHGMIWYGMVWCGGQGTCTGHSVDRGHVAPYCSIHRSTFIGVIPVSLLVYTGYIVSLPYHSRVCRAEHLFVSLLFFEISIVIRCSFPTMKINFKFICLYSCPVSNTRFYQLIGSRSQCSAVKSILNRPIHLSFSTVRALTSIRNAPS